MGAISSVVYTHTQTQEHTDALISKQLEYPHGGRKYTQEHADMLQMRDSCAEWPIRSKTTSELVKTSARELREAHFSPLCFSLRRTHR